ncbi:hypothetical protein BU26DRAFT_566125 [Trematosphaeria pertusa]|uniref:Uncharacterized protein n=1 Tax=Trematosphaeria pertusa TaxID=390896 RepID=A0A6A6IA57_9PLEO|nr:uncharacterized protein BU26DRAFT_566125 [Trematosphaeria pertusa]KAF2247129.1 hypothetical protein BU26DRAFT_566125 [Trematosphaeria pertusa]
MASYSPAAMRPLIWSQAVAVLSVVGNDAGLPGDIAYHHQFDGSSLGRQFLPCCGLGNTSAAYRLPTPSTSIITESHSWWSKYEHGSGRSSRPGTLKRTIPSSWDDTRYRLLMPRPFPPLEFLFRIPYTHIQPCRSREPFLK